MITTISDLAVFMYSILKYHLIRRIVGMKENNKSLGSSLKTLPKSFNPNSKTNAVIIIDKNPIRTPKVELFFLNLSIIFQNEFYIYQLLYMP